jgi:hypothetical protein
LRRAAMAKTPAKAEAGKWEASALLKSALAGTF